MSQIPTLEAIELAGRDVALTFHLTSRLYPPMPGGEALAKLAIDAVNDGEPERVVDDGISRRGPAGEIVESWHLEAFLEADEDW